VGILPVEKYCFRIIHQRDDKDNPADDIGFFIAEKIYISRRVGRFEHKKAFLLQSQPESDTRGRN
jgi:hypothetical protein